MYRFINEYIDIKQVHCDQMLLAADINNKNLQFHDLVLDLFNWIGNRDDIYLASSRYKWLLENIMTMPPNMSWQWFGKLRHQRILIKFFIWCHHSIPTISMFHL